MTSTNTLPIIIGHNDTLLNLYLPERGGGRSFFMRSDKGHIDLPRAQEAGLAGGFFAIFVPPESPGEAVPRLNIVVTEKGYEILMQAAIDPTAHTISPSTRNLTDKQLAAIKESEGLVGLNFSVGDLRDDGRHDPDIPLAKIVDHMDYLVEQLGIDCIALGTDFDGTRVPLEIGDVTGLPKLIEALRERGYSQEALHKIAYENWMRILRKTWKSSNLPYVIR